ncbi:MAG TPA: peptide chain release factor N(5)-glutamine methyltransferase [Erysipelotrichaceae bacterium]|nr:peptide chain release factor N(5)-glutamine methyltransferase [Erysipelotrichaceae bacterium]
MKTYNQSIIEANKELEQITGFSEARYLMLELCQKYNIDLFKSLDEPINKTIAKEFSQGVKRLATNEPVAHILGYSYFYGYKYKVNKDVLIPRSETELLVMNALLEIENHFHTYDLKMIDLACGSGIIGITMKIEESELHVSLSDISEEALEVAKKNAKRHEVDVNIFKSDMLDVAIKNQEKYDVIICNPPYIHDDEPLQKSVKDYEPHLALFGGVDGLNFYKTVLSQSKKVLNKPGLIGFEIGYDQKENISQEIAKHYPNATIKHFKDYAGLDRMVFVFIE